MLLTPHILIGVAIITKVQNPILGLLLVLLSHYFLDCFPQQEYSIKNIKERRWNKSFLDFLRVFFDISFGVLLILLLSESSSFILAAAFLAILPDGFTLLNLIIPKNKLLEIHNTFHQKLNNFFNNKKIPAFWGIVSQVAAMALAIYFLL